MSLEIRGRVLLGEDHEVDRLRVVDGRVTFGTGSGRVAGSGSAHGAHGAHGAQVIEGVALPGLVDVHCHVGLGADGPVDRATAEQQALADRDAGTLLIRDAGSPADTRWVDERADLPRLLRAGRHLARPKRYLRHFARELDEPGMLVEAVVEEARRGDGWVKIVADWIDRDLGEDGDLRPLWPDDVLTAAVRAVHDVGARVTAHVFSTEALPALLRAGVDCLEHGTGLTPELTAEVVARGIPVVPTALQVERFAEIAAQADGRYPRFAARMRAMHERRHTHVRELWEAGVQLLVGTDAGGTIEHGRLPDEAAALVAAGVPAADVVAAASWRARAFLGVPSLAEGEPADLVVYPADPRDDIEVLAHPRAVVLRGSVVRRA